MHVSLKIAAALLLVTATAACNRPEPTPGVNSAHGYWKMENGKAVWKEYHSSGPNAAAHQMHSTYDMGLGNHSSSDSSSSSADPAAF